MTRGRDLSRLTAGLVRLAARVVGHVLALCFVLFVVGVSLAGGTPVPIATAVTVVPIEAHVSATYGYDVGPARTTPPTNVRTRAQRAERTATGDMWSSTSSVSLRRAAKEIPGGIRTITALTREQDAALTSAMRDPNKLRHIFGKAEHNLGPLTEELGGQEALVREAVLAVPRGTTGTFEVTKRIGQYDLTVRGRVVNGVPRIGTVFVP